jgi:hypothetical protein
MWVEALEVDLSPDLADNLAETGAATAVAARTIATIQHFMTTTR